ncbi:two-component regulator propeller domain-containing protein [Hufsiella ginkgonis]|uniref:histidine kinase n=1 Tax=Hufsiella ginkgonis TaxID=2695274 RepID=A0A7K1XZE1_9SPHI|nr:two-component regulator propeller domain-containing protein [Hufsiella ginkgonis]MXV16384.1 response regulator [Hufsiella ginkgonis]
MILLMRAGKHNVLLIVVLFCSLAAGAQKNHVIGYLGTETGLSSSSVRCIYQDHSGFLWFGTYDGLNRYDGSDFKIFRNRYGDTTSLPHNWINAIAEDSAHLLWIGTRQGAGILNSVTGKFTAAWYTGNGSGARKKLTGFIKSILADKAGNVYVAAEDLGLVVFRKGSATGMLISAGSQPYNVSGFTLDGNGGLWLAVSGKGLLQYHVSNNRFTLVNNHVQFVSCIQYDHDALWIGTLSGVYRYVIRSNQYLFMGGKTTGMLASSRITSFLRAGADELWIGTDGGGITIYTISAGRSRMLNSQDRDSPISSDAVHALYLDHESRTWIGTLRGGINVIDPRRARFQTISHDPSMPNSLASNFILSLFEETPHKLWIGTDGGGLSIWNRKNATFKNLRAGSGNSSAPGGNFITSIKRDYLGNTWLATYEAGISRYIPSGDKFKQYYGYSAQDNSVNSTFWLIYEDRDHRLWAGGLQNGIYLYNRAADRFELFDRTLRDLLVLTEDRSAKLWGGAFSKLVQVDPETKRHQWYEIDKPVRAIVEDRYGNFWLGTEGGLMLFDRKLKRVVKRYTTADGLGSNYILTMQEDQAGFLWMSTYNGLSRFDPRTRKFNVFSRSDGVQKEFNYNASLKLTSGELAFGGIRGLTLFSPTSISGSVTDPSIVFTGLKINNLPTEQVSGYLAVLDNDRISEIRVPYNEAIFSFDFTAIQYPSAEQISYRYKMEGWDRGWINAGNLRSAIYTHLDPGSYTFRVNSTNPEGVWTNREISMTVIVLPPWYRTWWAYTLYVLFAAGCIYGYFRYRFRQKLLEFEVALARVNAEKQSAVHEKRLEFFTSISHEFRTPLSLIINPINDLLSRSAPQDAGDLHIIYRNARRLLSLVDQLLLFRKADSGISGLKVVAINLNQLCREVFLCFSQQAKSAAIHYELETTAHDFQVFADREKLEIILFNLLSNAIKFTPPHGRVTIRVVEEQEHIRVYVSDSGIGIPAEVGNRLFEKFYQSKSSVRQLKAGFGIGLYLASQFAADHYGGLTYTSEQGRGTTFVLSLLKGHAHFPADLVSMDDSPGPVFLEELSEEVLPAGPESQTVEDGFKIDDIFSENKVILVVDDDSEMRNYIKAVFSAGYLVYEAPEAETAMLLVKEKMPDLVICDVVMPGMNGIEWCAWLKQDPALSYIPVILLTASASSESKLKGLGCGADDYISKPFERDLLVARVANLVKTRNNLRNYFYNEITLQSNNIAISEEYKDFLKKCILVVEKHLTDQHFNVNSLISELGMSRSTLYRKVKSMSGFNINNFIRFIRLRKAAELLINTQYNVNEVATATGFSNMKYFRTQFSKLFGVNPSDFMKRNRPVFIKRFNVKN